MRTTRLIIAALAAAALAVAVMAGSAGAVPADDQPNGQYAGKSASQVLMPDLALGDASTPDAVGPTTGDTPADYPGMNEAPDATPPSPEPITGSHPVAGASSSGLDWGSAAIGAAAGIGAFAIALALTGGLRRRRSARPRSLPTP